MQADPSHVISFQRNLDKSENVQSPLIPCYMCAPRMELQSAENRSCREPSSLNTSEVLSGKLLGICCFCNRFNRRLLTVGIAARLTGHYSKLCGKGPIPAALQAGVPCGSCTQALDRSPNRPWAEGNMHPSDKRPLCWNCSARCYASSCLLRALCHYGH